MGMKALITVIVISILIGAGIFLVDRQLNQTSGLKLPQAIQGMATQPLSQLSPTPTPKPTPPPIGPDSSLEEEVDKLTPPDFSADFDQLQQLLNWLNSTLRDY